MKEKERDYRTPGEAHRLVEAGRRLFREHVGLEEREHGYVLTYPEDCGQRLSTFVEFVGTQHPWMAFEVSSDHGTNQLSLAISGPEGTKRWVREELSTEHWTGPSRWRRLMNWYRTATSFARAWPDFLIIGTPRSGTSSMFNLLSQHPAVVPAMKKEVAYFNVQYGRGSLWYRSHLPLRRLRTGGRTRTFATGEATPTYLFHPHAARRIREDIPDVKLVVMLRNPIDRAYSHYHWAVRTGFERLGFEDAIDREEARVAGELEKMLDDEHYISFPRSYLSYLGMGRYAEQIASWYEVFPREQFLFLSTDELKRGTGDALARVLRFLDLPDHTPEQTRPMNTAQYPEMSTTTRDRLREHFRPFNERLWELIGADYGWATVETREATLSPESKRG